MQFLKIGVMVLTVSLTGCNAYLRPALGDYNGSDASRVRIQSSGNTVLRFYKKQEDCYKKVLERRLTGAFGILGLQITTSKKEGMPASEDMKGALPTKEYRIQPDQLIEATHYYNNYFGEQTTSQHFIPIANHDYDILVKGSGDDHASLYIKDLTQPDSLKSWSGKTCRLGLFEQ
ncbi:hypothetical protein Xmau_04487 [Xenorhabdus mauleonii]|uniref:Lipoprotein n=1 Tax=Xenorhabdus mauleonii TaxID=351675 RepID=A0A1I3YB88_9GAMM|nr:hypothetical protein [Xenorhabdus mauleonii]PHM35629.1 hypothetical protein Xmau_04487 [Xenorhabdus mauleonii]SFK29118.1 hypothetical protein SAMN05421680_1492 [Xenorhabdus mauleonii]